MTTVTFNTAEDFNQLFNFDLQPRAIKTVNGIAVNVFNGSLIYNELNVTNKHVSCSSYMIEKQSDTIGFFKAPFKVEY
jgi:hypothetical protein